MVRSMRVMVLVVLVWLAGSAVEASIPEVEPNNSPVQATPLPTGLDGDWGIGYIDEITQTGRGTGDEAGKKVIITERDNPIPAEVDLDTGRGQQV